MAHDAIKSYIMQNNIDYAALSMNDIIFLNRNRDYGAYELRESYDRRIKQAMLGAILFISIGCSYQVLYSSRHPVAQPKKEEITTAVTQVEVPKETVQAPKPAEPPKPQGTPDPATVTNATLVPTNTADATDTVPDNTQLAETAISDHTSSGTTTGPAIGIETGTPDITTHTTAAPPATEIKDWVETMPEYPGGEQAMMRFLGDNIDYPYIDKELGTQGRVTVGFVIDEKGKVSDIKIVRGLTKTLNEESIRVVSLLKTFKPGVQGGHAVKVRYTLPINYQLKGE